MTNPEFSDAFSTMLNSYNTQMQFGEQASKAEIVLDEYEKSVFLTQAQDIIVKSYFDARLNAEGMGLDDGTKRQLDFSSLIRVASLSPLATQENTYDSRGIMYQMPIGADENSPQALFILNEKLVNSKTYYRKEYNGNIEIPSGPVTESVGEISIVNKTPYSLHPVIFLQNSRVGETEITYIPELDSISEGVLTVYFMCQGAHVEELFNSGELRVSSGLIQNDKFDIKFTRWFDPNHETYNESYEYPYTLTTATSTPTSFQEINENKEYVIVPISYKEYDRMMSRPYSQPLKKQAWRLFQNQVTGFDVQTELIPKFNVTNEDTVITIDGTDTTMQESEFIYKIRYVQRPTPIVLEDLPDGLSIDGVSGETPCMLNPVLHQDILNKAVDLAITTRGGTPAATQARQARRQEKD